MSISLKDIESEVNSSDPKPEVSRSLGLKRLLSIELNGIRLKDKERANFYEQFGTLLTAGLGVKPALELCRSQQKPKVKEVVDDLLHWLTSGEGLSSAMQKTEAFSSYEIFTVQIGEESGRLAQVLLSLKVHFEQKIARRRAIIGALSYPAVVVLTAFGAMAFMLSYLVPMFSDLFARAGKDLPQITKVVVAISEHLDAMGVNILILSLVFWLFNRLASTNSRYLLMRAKYIIRIPIIGRWIKNNLHLEFLQSMSLLLGSKVSIVRSLELCSIMSKSVYLKSLLEDIQSKIVDGITFSQAISQSHFFDENVVALIKVGEESNQLDSLIAGMANDKLKEIEHQGKVLNSILEPLLIVFLGGLVAIILVAMYLPMFQMGTSF